MRRPATSGTAAPCHPPRPRRLRWESPSRVWHSTPMDERTARAELAEARAKYRGYTITLVGEEDCKPGCCNPYDASAWKRAGHWELTLR